MEQNTASVFVKSKNRESSSGTSPSVPTPTFRINVSAIKTEIGKLILTNEDTGISPEEERNYYEKTLKGRLI